MLVLVLASNFLVMFVGWELVGLCSYLLIGFWFHDRNNATAAKKAFITNRVGDVSFAIGLFLIFATFGSLDFADVFGRAPEVLAIGGATATAIGLLLFGGAAGKSAQIPLYVWLPDAMAGPTPVSALIHAATMVTAGVYMVARASSLYVMSPVAMGTVAWIGIATALLAAVIATRQDDIKKVLAYSTVSQLGYMFVAAGVGAFGIGIFHLVTHAFFKGLLFLSAGSVMHALGGEADIWKMGGLRRDLKITFATTAVAWLAISGVPPLAGFFSKDQILASALEGGHTVIWVLGLLTALITAYYMSRWFFLIFVGRSRLGPDVHPHESPPTMTVPLVALGVATVGGGLLNLTHHGVLQRWLEPVLAHVPEAEVEPAVTEYVGIALAVLAAVVGIGLAASYLRAPREERSPLTTILKRKLYVDELYDAIFVKGGRALGRLALWFDERVIDGAVNGSGRVTASVAQGSRRLQGGLVRGYVGILVFGAVIVIAAFLIRAV